jgi:Cu-processing system permease protein
MTTIPNVAVHVFRDSVRDRVPYNLVFFAVLLMASSYLIGQLTAGQDVKIIKDLGLASASAIGLFIAIFIGIGLVAKEVERKSIYSLLAKPIRRYELVIGKYLGLVLTLAANLAVMAVAFYIVLAYMDWMTHEYTKRAWEASATDPRMLKAFVLIGVELALITAVAVFFSTFSSPFLSAALTLGVYVMGHFSADLRNLQTVVDSPVAATVGRVLYYIVPNLATLDIKADVVHAAPVSATYMLVASGYAALYIAALLVGSVWIFSRRDFK